VHDLIEMRVWSSVKRSVGRSECTHTILFDGPLHMRLVGRFRHDTRPSRTLNCQRAFPGLVLARRFLMASDALLDRVPKEVALGTEGLCPSPYGWSDMPGTASSALSHPTGPPELNAVRR
jgi:hypothetical protein